MTSSKKAEQNFRSSPIQQEYKYHYNNEMDRKTELRSEEHTSELQSH